MENNNAVPIMDDPILHDYNVAARVDGSARGVLRLRIVDVLPLGF